MLLTPMQKRALAVAVEGNYKIYLDPEGDRFMSAYLYRGDDERITIRQSTMRSFISKRVIAETTEGEKDPEHPHARIFEITDIGRKAAADFEATNIPLLENKPEGYITLREGLAYLHGKGSELRLITLQRAANESRLQAVFVNEAHGPAYYTTKEFLDYFVENKFLKHEENEA